MGGQWWVTQNRKRPENSGHFLHLNRIIKPWKWFRRYLNYKWREKKFEVIYTFGTIATVNLLMQFILPLLS